MTKAQSQKMRTKNCPFSQGTAASPSYKNPKLLLKYVSERGRILPRRITGVSAKMQRMLKSAIKVARVLALLPFSSK